VILSLAGCASALERARVARDGRDYARAEQYYRTSMSSDPADKAVAQQELAAMKIARAQAKLKTKPAEAEKLYREARTLAPSDEKALDGLGRALAEQGKSDEAITTLSTEGCQLCRRYLAVLLVERGWKREQAGELPGARADYEQAQTLVPDVSTALAIARMAEAMKDEEALLKAIEVAVPLIRADDADSQAQFKRMREKGVMAAAARADVTTVDRWMNFFPPGAGGDDWYALQLKVAQQLRLENQLDLAVARARHLLGPKHAGSLPANRKTDLEKLLADIYRVLGAKFLREGKVVEADDNFRQAMEFAPDDNKIKLLRALAIAGTGDVKKGLDVVRALPSDTKGHSEVLAILESMIVHDRLAEGDVAGAREALTRAQAANAEQPEVHVAMAELLVVSPVEKLPKKAVKEVKKSGLVKYPNDEINRYGEALSELAWAREQARGLGEGYLFRGPGSDKRMDALERQIKAFYPFTVEFNPESTTILKLRGSGGEVEVRGPGDFAQTVFVPAGGSSEVVVREPGLVTLRAGKRTVALVTEPYTKMTVEL
jgi:Flp pilus assembly protein TadD